MNEKLVKIIDPIGLHARPASILVATAAKYKENKVNLVINESKTVDAKSILVVLGCAIEANQEFSLRVSGDNSEEILSEIISELKTKDIIVEA